MGRGQKVPVTSRRCRVEAMRGVSAASVCPVEYARNAQPDCISPLAGIPGARPARRPAAGRRLDPRHPDDHRPRGRPPRAAGPRPARSTKHRRAFEEGVVAPFSDADPGRHMKNPDGSGHLDRVTLAEAVEAAMQAIRGHRPFEEIVRRLGRGVPLRGRRQQPPRHLGRGRRGGAVLRRLPALRGDRRAPVPPGLLRRPARAREAQRDVSPLLAESLRRGRELYPMVGREYRRIGFGSGIGRFDDRSTRLRRRLAGLQPRGDRRDPGAALYLDHGRRRRRPHRPAGRRDAAARAAARAEVPRRR